MRGHEASDAEREARQHGARGRDPQRSGYGRGGRCGRRRPDDRTPYRQSVVPARRNERCSGYRTRVCPSANCGNPVRMDGFHNGKVQAGRELAAYSMKGAFCFKRVELEERSAAQPATVVLGDRQMSPGIDAEMPVADPGGESETEKRQLQPAPPQDFKHAGGLRARPRGLQCGPAARPPADPWCHHGGMVAQASRVPCASYSGHWQRRPSCV